MYRLSTVINTAATLFLLFTSPATLATELLIVDESLDTLPSGYLVFESASDNATADIHFGNLGTSNGLIFDASWNVPVNGYEGATGGIYPEFLSFEDFQLDPREIGGFTSVRWTLDTEVISSTLTAPDQGVFVEMGVFQLKNDGNINSFAVIDTVYVVTGQPVSLDITFIGSDFGPPAARPDFSATGLPIAFSLRFYAAYEGEMVVDARVTAQNWTVSVNDRAAIFSDGFESQTSGL